MTTPNKKDKEALGKGIRSLLQSIDSDLKIAKTELISGTQQAEQLAEQLPLQESHRGDNQA